jgi:GNAT superfamily N-acetyltransferase
LAARQFAHDTVWRLDDFAAVALWLSPNTEPDADEIVRVLMTTVDESRHNDTVAAIEQMDAAHPRYPHWYLPWFGVDARLQGTGLGGTLLTDCLSAVDETELPAYLETPNTRTISFYKRHGFRVTGSTRTADCPPITFMLREPNPGQASSAGAREGDNAPADLLGDSARAGVGLARSTCPADG